MLKIYLVQQSIHVLSEADATQHLDILSIYMYMYTCMYIWEIQKTVKLHAPTPLCALNIHLRLAHYIDTRHCVVLCCITMCL